MNGNGFVRNDNSASIATRIMAVTYLIVGIIALYGVYLFALQVVNGSEYRKRASEVARREVLIPAQRGQIFDRNYDVPLVVNRPSYAIDLAPGQAGKKGLDVSVGRLAEMLHVTPAEILARIPSRPLLAFQPVQVASGVPYGTISYLAEHIDEFPGVSWHSKPMRAYPFPGSLSHVVGYVGDITSEELQVLYNEGYDAASTIGKGGVEKVYDGVLRGTDGKSLRVVDVHGRSVVDARVEDIPPVSGKNIVLTIDRHVQELAEKALGNRIGSVVVLKPSTGELLALVSYPWFDPSVFSDRRDAEQMRQLFLDPSFPFLNRAIQSSYAPASTFKIIMTAADLEENLLPPSQAIVCKGSMDFGNRVWHDWELTGHGPVDLADALAESCDVYFWTLGTRYLGIDRIVEYASRFGLGRKSGVDLPGEVAGLVPTPEWKENNFRSQWLGGDTMNMSIGQGNLLATPLQLADVIAMVANGGVVYTPHVLKEVRDPTTGAILREVRPQVMTSSGISKGTFLQLAANMRGVVTHGTANVVITTNAVEIAGKTGTGEVGKKEHFTSWFASFGPYNPKSPDEQIVVVVMIEATNDWDWWAPKAANIIYQGYFAHQSYEQAVNTLVRSASWYLQPIRINDR